MQTARKKNPSQNCALQLHALFHSIFHIFILLELFSAFATFVKEVEIEKKNEERKREKTISSCTCIRTCAIVHKIVIWKIYGG